MCVCLYEREAMKRGNLNAQMCLYTLLNVCKQKEMKKIVSFYIFLSYITYRER